MKSTTIIADAASGSQDHGWVCTAMRKATNRTESADRRGFGYFGQEGREVRRRCEAQESGQPGPLTHPHADPAEPGKMHTGQGKTLIGLLSPHRVISSAFG